MAAGKCEVGTWKTEISSKQTAMLKADAGKCDYVK